MLKSAVIEENKLKHSPKVGGRQPIRAKLFYVNRKASSLRSFVASLKRISSTSDFIHIFSWFNKCVQAQIRGSQPKGTKFLCQQKPLVTSVICYKLKKTLCSLILYIFFHDFIHVYSPGQGLTTPWGRKFDVNRNILSLLSFVASFKKSLKSDFIQFFHDFIYVYKAQGQGQT